MTLADCLEKSRLPTSIKGAIKLQVKTRVDAGGISENEAARRVAQIFHEAAVASRDKIAAALKGGEADASGKPSTAEVGVRSEGGEVGKGTPLRQSGETPSSSTEEKAGEEKPTGRSGELQGLSFKAELDDGSGFASNGLRFATKEEAEKSGRETFNRWMGAKEMRVVPSDEPVTHKWEGGKNVAIEEAKAPALTPEEQAAADELFSGLSASAVEVKQKPLPVDKGEALFKFAQLMTKNGVDTPEALAAKLPEAGRPYAQAIWSTMAAFNPKLQKEPDWSTLLSGLGARSEPSVVSGTRPSAGTVAGQTSGTPRPERPEGVSGQPSRSDVEGSGEVEGETGLGTRTGVADVGVEPQSELRPGEPEATIAGTPAEAERLQEQDIRSRRSAGLNHRILPEHEIAPRGEVTKTRANIAAIKLLKRLEADDKEATPAEKETLAKYVGWGGLSQSFDPFKKLGVQFNEELKSLLTEDEYDAARRSTLNAHYTSREAIEAIWQAVERLGFKGGTVGEYGAGIGHFFGLMPPDLQSESKLLAVERDELSARIMSKLYPGARVRVGALQDLKTKPNSVDLFVGNVPFDQNGPSDKNYPTLNLHNYFLARILDDLKPGGIAVVISTHNTLDAQPVQRAYLASKGELVGAIRLPNTAFKENAGTEVNADILIFRKPVEQRPAPEPFLSTVDMPVYNADTIDLSKNTQPITVNEYFGRHPDMILGLVSREGSMYGPAEPAIIPFTDEADKGGLGTLIRAAADKLPREVFGAIDMAQEPDVEHAVADAADKPNSIIHKDGKLYIVSESKELVPASDVNPRFTAKEVKKRAKDFIDVRETYKQLLAAQTNPETAQATVEALRADLNKAYDRYVKRHGALNRLKSNVFSDDPEYGLLQSLENVDSEEVNGKLVNVYNKAPVFTRRTQFPYTEPTEAENVRDGMLTSLGYRGRIDPQYIASLTGKTTEEVEEELESEKLAYHEPDSGTWQTNDHYLSGNVRMKLKAAEKAAESDPRYDRNIEALKGIQPKAISMVEINVRLGGAWVPQKIVSQFGQKLFNAPNFTATYVEKADAWITSGNVYTVEGTSTYAGGTMTGNELFKQALNLKTPRVMDTIPIGDGKTRKVFNPIKTAAAQAAQDKIMTEFKRYVTENADVAELLENAYNEVFNGHVLPTFDGSHLVLPGSSAEVTLRPHQKDAIWRIIQDGYAMLAHAVGAGKTYVMIGAAMEMRRLGLARKPMLVAKNATLSQFAASFRKMYPSANVLVGSKADLSKEKRNQFMARIASGDWDAVVVAQSSFNLLPSDPAREIAFIRGMLADLVEAIREAKAKTNSGRDPTVKELEKAKEKLETQLKELAKRPKDNTITFEQLGVDALFIDEAHDYKKPPYVTKLDRVGGLQKQISQRAFALLMKTRFIQEKNKGRNVILATGTPVTNTLGEAWHMLRLGAPHLLDEYGVDTFDRFVSTFATIEAMPTTNAVGNWVIRPMLARFVNGPELVTMIRSGWDVVTTEELHDMFREQKIPIPVKIGGKTRVIAVGITPPVSEYMDFLHEVFKAYNATPNKKPISAVPVLTYMSGRVAALEPRLVNPNAEDHPNSKVNTLVRGVAEVYKETTPNKSTQLIFFDNYKPFDIGYLTRFAAGEGITLDMEEEEQGLESEAAGAFNLYDDIREKLIASGVPSEEIANINDYKTPTKQTQLFDAFNAGKIRVLMGGTDTLGTGVNVQDKAYALWHLDATWMPSGIEQREGRIVRQGNENPEVAVNSVGMKNTVDAGLYTKLLMKAKFFRQVLSGKFTGREFDDPTGPLILSAEEQQALLSGNPLVLKKVEADNLLRNLLLEEEGHNSGKGETGRRLRSEEAYLKDTERGLATYEAGLKAMGDQIDGEHWKVKIGAQELNERKSIVAAIDRIIGAAKITKEVNYHDPGDLRNEGQLVVQLTANGVEVKVYGGMYRARFDREGEFDKRLASIMSIDGHDIYAGEAKTGNGILGVLSDLPEDLKGRIEARKGKIVEGKSNIAKFKALLDQPFERAEELAAAKAEVARINAELTADDTASKTASEELFNIGYTAAPLLSRIDQAITEAKAELKAIGAERPRMETPAGEVRSQKIEVRTGELEDRIKALGTRRAFVEKTRYDAALRGEMTETPYKWTPTGKPARPLAASVPQTNFTPGLDITEAKQGIQSLLLPSAMSAEHLRAAELVGSKLGPMHRRQEQTRAQFQSDWMAFEKMGVHRDDVSLVKNRGIQFMSDVSQGKNVAPELAKTRDKIEAVFANRMELLEKADAPMQQVRENYFPGMWTTESRRAFNQAMEDAVEKGVIDADTFNVNSATQQQETWIRERTIELMDKGAGSDKDALRYVSRKPLKGPETYKKQKVFDDIMTAVRFGLIPISNNPIDLVALKLAEIDRSIMANQVFQALRDKKQLKTIKPSEKTPDGWVPVLDKYGTVYGPPTIGEGEDEQYVGLRILGRRVVTAPVGDILNNYLSSSLYNNRYFGKVYSGWMGMANLLNQTQLGVGSAFHAGFTTAEAQISATANLIKDVYGLLRGNRSLTNLIASTKSVATATVETAMTGDKVLNAWRNPDGSIDPRILQVVRAAELAGAGFRLEQGLRTDQSSKFLSDWLNGHRLRAARRSPVAFIEMLAKPIMDLLVPRQKAGVFAHLVWRIIEQNPDKPLDALTSQFRAAWNRVDARLGQVRYDRLFINNVAKNVIQGSIRAPGWSGGTIAELGGSFKDAYGFFEEFAKTGKLPADIPDRVAYVIALLITVAVINAVLTFAFTGEAPKGLDYWAFRTGGKDLQGNQERFVLPTYVKDIMAYAKAPLTTLSHKMHPIISVFGDLIRNADYYGIQIRDTDANVAKQAMSIVGYVAKSFTPFWIRGAAKTTKEHGGFTTKAVLPLIGIMPATRQITQTRAQAIAAKINQATLPAAPKTQRQEDRRLEKSAFTSQIRRGQTPNFSKALSRGTIKGTDIKELYKRATLSPLGVSIDHMTLENAEKVYAAASPLERQQLTGIMARKRANSLNRKGRTMFTGF